MELDRSCYWAPGRTCDYELNENENFVFIVATSEGKQDGKKSLLDIIIDSVRKCSINDEQLEPKFAQFEKITGVDIFCSKICGYIKRSGLIIVDLTPRKEPICVTNKCKKKSNYPSPNVYWEYGFASGLNKKIITICDKKQIEKLPFDIQSIGHIEYEKEKLYSFEGVLTNFIEEKLKEVIQIPKKKKEEYEERLKQNIKNWLEPFIGNFRDNLDNNYDDYREFFSFFFPYVNCRFFKIEQDNISKSFIYLSKSNSSRDLVTTPQFINFNVIKYDPMSTIDRMNDDDIDRILTSNGFLGDVDTISPSKNYDMRITLPANFLKIKSKLIIEHEINQIILRKINESLLENLIRKSINRLSLITEEDINKISDFLGLLEPSSNISFKEQEIRELENVKNRIFEKIFFYLGFEVIPLESLKKKKILEFKDISYPNLIIYDLYSNYIILIEEQLGFNTEKKEIKSIVYDFKETLGKFRSFFPEENRKVNFVYIGPELSIEPMYLDEHMSKYMGEYIWVPSNDFVKHSTNIFNKNEIFNKDIFKKPLFENFKFKNSLKSCIELIKKEK